MGHYAAEMACPQCDTPRCRCPAPDPKPWTGWILSGEGARPMLVAEYAQQRAGDSRGMIELALMGKTVYETEALAQQGRRDHIQQLIAEGEARLAYLRAQL